MNHLDLLDIPSNKNDTYASFEKQKINKRTDIDACEKKLLKAKIDFNRKSERQHSAMALRFKLFCR